MCIRDSRDRGFTGGELLVGMASAQLAGEDFLVGLDRQRADAAGQVLAPVDGLSSTTAAGPRRSCLRSRSSDATARRPTADRPVWFCLTVRTNSAPRECRYSAWARWLWRASYADLRIMPMSGPKALVVAVSVVVRSA